MPQRRKPKKMKKLKAGGYRPSGQTAPYGRGARKKAMFWTDPAHKPFDQPPPEPVQP